MKLAWIFPLVVFSLGPFCLAQSSPPIPVGMRHAHELEAQNERDLEPPAPARRVVKLADLKGEAAQLADLAASIPGGVNQLGKGLVDKDLIQNLKRIEKLSKHLRSQLDH